MLGRLLLLLILLPAIEVAILVWLAMKTSLLTVVGLLVVAGVVGTFLARQQGVRALGRLSDEVRRGKMPGDALLDAVLVSGAALLLILPGLLSDALAILLLFPPTRSLFKTAARRSLQGRVVTTQFYGYQSPGGRDEIIDVQVLDSPPPKLGG